LSNATPSAPDPSPARGGGVELPRVVAVVDDHGGGEGDGGPDDDGLDERDVGRGQAAVGRREVVDARAVVEGDAARGVVGGDGRGFGRAGACSIRRLSERRRARCETDLAVLVGRVGVRHGELALRCDEHRLEALALSRVGGPRDGGRFRGRLSVDALRGTRRHGDLGEAVPLRDDAGHADGVTEGDLADGAGRVDEQGVGCRVGGEIDRATRAGGLDHVAVEAAGRVMRCDDALRGDRLADVAARHRRRPGRRRWRPRWGRSGPSGPSDRSDRSGRWDPRAVPSASARRR
jgi:hypothetical protein